MESKSSDNRSSNISKMELQGKQPYLFPSPAGKSLLQRYLIYARTTLTLLCVEASVGAATFWYFSSTLNKKIGALYSKSMPHRLERQKHLYVNNFSSQLQTGGPSINEVEEEVEVVAESESKDKNDSGSLEDKFSRLKDGAFKLFNRGKDDVLRGLGKVQELASSDWSHFHIFKRDDPDVLMKLVLSSNPLSWKFGVEALGTMPHRDWRNDDFWRVAQALDPKAIIALSQYPDVDLRFFLPVKFSNLSKKRDLYGKLRSLLAELPLQNADTATKYFSELALKFESGEPKDPSEEEDDMRCYGDSFLGGEYLEYHEAVKHITVKSREKRQLHCLQALICHSLLENNHDLFVKLPILPYLLELIAKVDCDNTKLLVAQIIGNVSCHPDVVKTLVLSGWIGVLVKWRQSEKSAFRLQLAASRALINIHGSFFLSHHGSSFEGIDARKLIDGEKKSIHVPCLLNGVYAYDPFQSFFTGNFEADVIFVHGLLGGAAYTWRQSVACADVEKELLGEKPRGTCPTDYSNCWPKDWLAKDLNNVRIIGVEYSTQLSDWEPVQPYETPEERTITARAKELLIRLEAADVGKKRPIIWVTHSMGGLLVKEILRLAEMRNEEDGILVNSCGVIFYGTPHKGSPLANISNNFFYIVFPTIEVQELSNSNSEYLNKLNDHFGKLVAKGLQCLSFAELKETSVVIRPNISISRTVVPLSSADPGTGKFIPLDTDHLNVCKPGSKDGYMYATSLDFMKNCLAKKKLEMALERAIFAIEKGWQLTEATEDAANKGKNNSFTQDEETELTE